MVINLTEKIQIFQQEKYSAVIKLLEILQGKNEKDVQEFIKVLVKNKMITLALFMEELIEKVKKVKKMMDGALPVSNSIFIDVWIFNCCNAFYV